MKEINVDSHSVPATARSKNYQTAQATTASSGGGGGATSPSSTPTTGGAADTAKVAQNLAADSADWAKILRKDIDERTENSLSIGKDITVDGKAILNDVVANTGTFAGLLKAASATITGALLASTVSATTINATTLIGELQGNAATSTKLKTPRNILGIPFDGSTDCNGNASITGTLGVGGALTSAIIHSTTIDATTFIGELQGNAATATKLKTARTIWGQSFDGSGNVDGNININGTLHATGSALLESELFVKKGIIIGENTYSLDGIPFHGVIIGHPGYNVCNFGEYGGNFEFFKSFDSSHNATLIARINTDNNYLLGNLGIGTTTPRYKLDVNGNARFTSNLYADATVGTRNFASRTTGWQVNAQGAADFRNVYADELRVQAFTADISQALAGSDYLTKSVSKLSANFVVPAVNSTVRIIVDDIEGMPATRCFANGDYIRFRAFNRTSGLTIANVWGTVTLDTTFGTNGFSNGTQAYTFTCKATSGAGLTVFKGSEVLDYGTSGSGMISRTTLDAQGSPYEQIATWVNDPSVSTNYTVHARLGNLNGIANCNGYGLYTDNGFFTGKITVGDLTKNNNYLDFSGGALTVKGNVYLASGDSAVGSNGVISAINLTRETATIKASKINLVGAVTIGAFDPSVTASALGGATPSDVSTAVNNIQVGGRNLLHESEYFMAYNNYKVPCSLYITGDKYYNMNIWELSMTPTDSNVDDFRTNLSSHGVYTASKLFYAANKYVVSVYWKPISNQNIEVGLTASNIGGWTDIETIQVGGGWRRSSAIEIRNSDNSDFIYFSFRCPSAVSGTPIVIQWTCPMLEMSTKATDWSPAPEDVAQDVTNKVNALSAAHGGFTFLDSNSVYTGTLTANQVNAVGINANSIITGTLNANRIAGNSITGDKIVANSITGDKLVMNTITANQINATSVSAAIATVISLDANSIITGTLAADRINSVDVVTRGLSAQTINANNATISNLNVVNATISGTLNGVSGTFNYLQGVGSNGKFWFNNTYGSMSIEDEDFRQQGTKNSRTLRYYAANIRCRGSFGALRLNMARVHDTYIDYYVNGDTNSFVRFNLQSNGVGGYYIPLYPTSNTGYSLSSGNAALVDVSGFPVDLLIFNNSGTYQYEMLSDATGKKVIAVNANNNNTVYLAINGLLAWMLQGGKVQTFINIGEFMTPSVSSSVHGAGWMMCGEFDNNWA